MNEKMQEKADKTKQFLKLNGPRLLVGAVTGLMTGLALYYKYELENTRSYYRSNDSVRVDRDVLKNLEETGRVLKYRRFRRPEGVYSQYTNADDFGEDQNQEFEALKNGVFEGKMF